MPQNIRRFAITYRELVFYHLGCDLTTILQSDSKSLATMSTSIPAPYLPAFFNPGPEEKLCVDHVTAHVTYKSARQKLFQKNNNSLYMSNLNQTLTNSHGELDGQPAVTWAVHGSASKAVIACSYLLVGIYSTTCAPIRGDYPLEIYLIAPWKGCLSCLVQQIG